MKYCAVYLVFISLLAGCGGSSSSVSPEPQLSTVPVVTPNLLEVTVSGKPVELGIFDPAPTVDEVGGFWMSYSHVSLDTSGLRLVETRVASSSDAGISWADAGLINSGLAFMINADTVSWEQEVSRLVYNPFASTSGADPWIILWHRYLSVLVGSETVRLFDNGWIAMKSGNSATTLGGERKLFSGSLYNTAQNAILGAPEVTLNLLDPALADCIVFSEPGVLPKSSGIYVSLFCAKATPPGKTVLLRCDHEMRNCSYLGDLIDGSEAALINSNYDEFSASELVAVNGEDYLIVTPSDADTYRGCAIYKITDLDLANIERVAGVAKLTALFEAHGEFNGACGYVEGLTGSGVMISEAFPTSVPIFRIFTSGYNF